MQGTTKDKTNCWSENDIIRAGIEARKRPEKVAHNCGFIVEQMERVLTENMSVSMRDFDGGARHILVGDTEMKHFILVLPGKYIEGYHPDNEVWIDPSFDQFNDTIKENGEIPESFGSKTDLEPVRIMGTDDERLNDYTIPFDQKSLL